MFSLNPTDDDRDVEAAFFDWIVDHPGDLGLSSGVQIGDLGLRQDTPFRHQHDWLTFFRFRQEYRGVPVHGPDALVQLETHPHGAISLSGAIVDGRPSYDGLSSSSTDSHARFAAQQHVAAQTGIPASELVGDHAVRVAVPEWERICWRVFVHHGGIPRGMVLLGTDPPPTGEPLPLLHYDSMLVEGLADEVPIELIGEDPESVTDHLELYKNSGFADLLLTELSTNAPLIGSTVDPADAPSNEPPQLATERVVLFDLLNNVPEEDPTTGVTTFPDFIRITDPNGEFHDAAGHGFQAQRIYWLVQSAYDLVHDYMQGRWDSARPAIGLPSLMPPGAFIPRIFVGYRGYSTMCTGGAACATFALPPTDPATFMEWPDNELTQFPPSSTNPFDAEAFAMLGLQENSLASRLMLHEAGHTFDFFLGPGKADVPMCPQPCNDTTCDEDTSDEGRALTETIAQLWTLIFVRHMYAIDYEDACPLIGYLFPSPVSTERVHGPACLTTASQVRLMIRPDDPQCPTASQCDKPSTVASGDHFCDAYDGYRVASLMQAFWELANGRHCDPAPPFACEALPVWPPDCESNPQVECATPLDLLIPAYAYALRLRPTTYRQLVDGFVRYVGCNYGDALYHEVNAVLCHHGATDCAAPPPVDCADCGNNVREGGEECDGQDWIPNVSCEAFGFDGGMLACNQQTCELDLGGCYHDPVTTMGSAGSGDSGDTGATVGDDGGGGGGCGCRASAQHRWTFAWLLVLLGFTRRRKIQRSAAAILLAASCGDDEARATNTTPSTSTEPSTSMGEGTTEDAFLPDDAWLGYYRKGITYEGEPVSFPVAAGWLELEIRDDGTCHVMGRDCRQTEPVPKVYECLFHEGFVRMRNFDGSPITNESHIYIDWHFTSECGVLHEYRVRDPAEHPYPTEPRIVPWLRGRLCVVETCPEDAFDHDPPMILESPWVYDLCPGESYDCPCAETAMPCGEADTL